MQQMQTRNGGIVTDPLPLVTILTPVYNGELYLEDCVNSILNQTYQNWQYYIVNNCSTDSSLKIATKFSEMSPRIHVVNNTEFVSVIQNHNIAFTMVSPSSKYCKVVSADDWLYPECIAKMVEVAELHKTAGIVGSYQLSGGGDNWEVKWCGLPYHTTFISGREICRATLLGGRYVFGCPTSVLYKSALVRENKQFYPNLTPQADVSAFYQHLAHSDFAFVHQILSFERIHDKSVGSHCKKLATQQPSVIRDLIEFGPLYLTEFEVNLCLKKALKQYYEVIVEGIFHFEDMEFWSYHKGRFNELGYSLFNYRLSMMIIGKVLDLMLDPFGTIKKIWRRFHSQPM
jgi:glycosyltransferase involved in cell wall biosynthesis